MRLNDWIRLIKRQPPDWVQDATRLLDDLGDSGGRNRPGWAALERHLPNTLRRTATAGQFRLVNSADLDARLRTLYSGWNHRIEQETEAKLEELERRTGVRSSLEVIGMALLIPSPTQL